jgi:cysteine-rich repeat protein
MRMRHVALVAVGSMALGLLSFGTTAHAQVSSQQRACLTAFDKAVQDVAKAQGKAVARCLRSFAKGALAVPPEQCMLADPTGRLARAAVKAVAKVDDVCAQGLPSFGVTPLGDAVARAAIGEIQLLRGAMGPSLDAALIPNVVDATCQQRVGEALLRCADARRKIFGKCLAGGLRGGTITDAASMTATCLGTGDATQPDPGGKLRSLCSTKVSTAVLQHCRTTDLASAFAAYGTTNQGVLSTYLTGESGCQLCQLTDAVHGLSRDCDRFDDGNGGNGTCGPECGDAIVQIEEGCDDGNSTTGDGCSAICGTEPGWTCTGSPSTCTRNCGNGTVNPGETCDDGDTTSGDGCSATCSVESGWVCTGAPSVCTPKCGNGVVTPAEGEACDDGDATSGDGCSSSCTVEPGWVCTGSPSHCTFVCGNGSFQAGESCDDGNANAGDGCSAICRIEPGWICSGMPSHCTPVCGDGFVRAGEGCDDGNVTAGDGCSFTCQVETGFTCAGSPNNCTAICGDGFVRGNENCDDGDTASGDGCDGDLCRQEPGWTCVGQPSSCTPTCGNGQLDQFEECDDGDATSGDGCSATCRAEPGWACGGTPSTCVLSCGNGTIDAGETCDDGNALAGDGCSGSCRNESGWVCSTAGTPCSQFQIFVDSPANGTFTTAASAAITGHYTALPPGQGQVLINGVPASSVNPFTRTFSHTVPLDQTAIFNPVHARLVNLANGDDLHDRVTVIAGPSVADGDLAPQSVAMRMNDSGIDAIEPLVSDLAAGQFDLATLVPTGTEILPWKCYFQFIWCWAGASAAIGSPAPSFDHVSFAADANPGSVAADITLDNLRIDIQIDGTGLVSDCGLRLTANALKLKGDYTLEPDAHDPSFVDVNLASLNSVEFVGFQRQFVSGSCGLVEGALGDVESLARDAITGFIDDPDGNGPEDSPLADAIEDALSGVSISGAVGSGLGLQLEAPLFAVNEDAAGITLGASSRFTVSAGNGPGQCQPPPGAPNLNASYAPPAIFPSFGATAPVTGSPYDVGIAISPAGFNQLLRAQTECGLLRTSLSVIDIDGPGGADPFPIDSTLLSLLAPEFGQLPLGTPLRIDIAPTVAPLVTGANGPNGELEELRIAQVGISVVEPATGRVWLKGAFDARLGMNLAFLPDGSGLGVTLSPPSAADTAMTVTFNPLGADESQIETVLPSIIRPLVPDLASALSGFPLPEFFGLRLAGIEVSHNGDFSGLFADLVPVP